MYFPSLLFFLLPLCNAYTALLFYGDGGGCSRGSFDVVNVGGNLCGTSHNPKRLYDAARMLADTSTTGATMRVFSTLEDNPCGQMIGSVGPFKCLTTEVEMITGVMIIPPVPLISLPWANKIFHYGETVDHEPCEHDKVVSHGYVDGATVYQIPADSEIGRVYDAMVEGEEKQAFIKAHAHTQHEISESPYHWDI